MAKSPTIKEIIISAEEALSFGDEEQGTELRRQVRAALSDPSVGDRDKQQLIQLLSRLDLLCLGALSEENVEELLSTRLYPALTVPDEELNLEDKFSFWFNCLSMPDAEAKAMQKFKLALERNGEILGTEPLQLTSGSVRPTIGNWLKLLTTKYGNAGNSSLGLFEFLNKEPAAAKLGEEQRQALGKVLRFYRGLNQDIQRYLETPAYKSESEVPADFDAFEFIPGLDTGSEAPGGGEPKVRTAVPRSGAAAPSPEPPAEPKRGFPAFGTARPQRPAEAPVPPPQKQAAIIEQPVQRPPQPAPRPAPVAPPLQKPPVAAPPPAPRPLPPPSAPQPVKAAVPEPRREAPKPAAVHLTREVEASQKPPVPAPQPLPPSVPERATPVSPPPAPAPRASVNVQDIMGSRKTGGVFLPGVRFGSPQGLPPVLDSQKLREAVKHAEAESAGSDEHIDSKLEALRRRLAEHKNDDHANDAI